MSDPIWTARHRFFVEQSLVEGQTVALDTLAHQLQAVLRMTPGDQVILLDGSGNEYLVELEIVARHRAAARVLAARAATGEPTLRLTLFQATLKQDRFEWVLQKGTELGVARFVPVIAERSVVRPASTVERKYSRWRVILREAAEQCGRPRIPELLPPLIFSDAVTACAGIGLLSWEEEKGPSLVEALGEMEVPSHDHHGCISLMIGPEGGLATAEVAAARAAGWHTVTLGPRILRAETAALAACTIVLAMTGQLGYPSVPALTE